MKTGLLQKLSNFSEIRPTPNNLRMNILYLTGYSSIVEKMSLLSILVCNSKEVHILLLHD